MDDSFWIVCVYSSFTGYHDSISFKVWSGKRKNCHYFIEWRITVDRNVHSEMPGVYRYRLDAGSSKHDHLRTANDACIVVWCQFCAFDNFFKG